MLSGLLCLFFLSSHAQYRTERTGYEGDYFSLEGALDLFRESSTLDNFERRLNSEKYWVNNLDLNYDGNIDYVRVEHRRQGNFHAIILQALVDRYEVQDVAVIEIEVLRRGEAILQIIGDEDLYGQEVVVEPIEGYADSRRGYDRDYGDYVNVYYWRPVQYLLGRQYRLYASPYQWQYYPTWWAPRFQLSWNIFRPRIVIYTNRFRIAPRIRVVRVHNFYRPYRSYCPTVLQRSNTVRVRQGRSPIYRNANDRQNGRTRATPRNQNTDVGRTPAGSRSTPRNSRPSTISRKRSEEAIGSRSRGSSTTPSNQRSRRIEGSTRTSRRSEANGSRSSDSPRTYSNSGDRRSRNETPKARPSNSPERSRGTVRSTSPNSRQSNPARSSSSRSRSKTPSSTKARSSNSNGRASGSLRSSTPKSRQSTPSRSGVSQSRSSAPARSKARQAPPPQKKASSGSRSKANRSQPARSRSSSSPAKSRKGRE